MPKPGVTPQPAVKRGADLPYGEATAVNDLAARAPAPQQQDFAPTGQDQSYLFGPTDRPGEPITTGAPFGPGADVSRHAFETDSQMADRVAEALVAKGGSPQALAWAKRRQRGE